jgi:hypothetical protein
MTDKDLYLSLIKTNKSSQTIQTNTGTIFRNPYNVYRISPTLSITEGSERITWYWDDKMKYDQYTILSTQLTADLRV